MSPSSRNEPIVHRVTSNSGATGNVFTPSPPDTNDSEHSLHELQLLRHYRYHVAIILDLGTGRLFYGIEVLLHATGCKAIYNAVLALACLHISAASKDANNASVEESLAYEQESSRQLSFASPYDRMTALILLAWRNLILLAPESWRNGLADLYSEIASLYDSLPEEHSLMILRLGLAVALMSSQGTTALRYRRQLVNDDSNTAPTQTQLRRALMILDRTIEITNGPDSSISLAGIASATIWTACWKETQVWYQGRSEDMQPIFEAMVSGSLERQEPEASFPAVVFSNATATVANIIHHLSAMFLLKQKPRLIRPQADERSSTSPLWHALRIIGIAATAAEEDTWDPLVLAAVTRSAQMLSHETQLAAVEKILRNATRLSGMNFDSEINGLRNDHQISFE